jgi:DnaK suppressor protein
MDIARFKQRLLDKQQDLLDSIARSDNAARESRDAEVEDPIDQVTSSELKAGAFAVSTVGARTLEQVRAALQRIQDGSYGKCIDCGRPIEPARLEAVPWTPYCRADQEKHDAARVPAL